MRLKVIHILLSCFLVLSCNNSRDSESDSLELKAPVISLNTAASHAVKDWEGYNKLEQDLALIANTNALNAIDMLDDLAMNSNKMSLGIPEDLETPSIIKKVEKIDSEINAFYANVNRNEIRESVIENHIETVVKAFDTLNKELNRVL